MKIKVLGTGCKTCKKLYEDVSSVISEKNLNHEVEYISDFNELLKYNIMTVPALVIDEKVVSTGVALKKSDIENILDGDDSCPSSCSSCSCGCK